MSAWKTFIFISLHLFYMHIFSVFVIVFVNQLLILNLKFTCYFSSRRSLLKIYVEKYETTGKSILVFVFQQCNLLSRLLPRSFRVVVNESTWRGLEGDEAAALYSLREFILVQPEQSSNERGSISQCNSDVICDCFWVSQWHRRFNLSEPITSGESWKVYFLTLLPSKA